MRTKEWLGLILLLCLLLPATVFAQNAADEAAPVEETSAENTDPPVIHIVGAGDSLFTIATQYGTTVDQLMALNSLTISSLLQIGQEIVVSGVVTLPISASVIQNDTILYWPDLPPVPKYHVVQGGESLTAIAEAYGQSAETILTANQLAADALLQVGQKLFIPNVTGDLIALEYEIGLGDTVESISAEFNTHPAALFLDGPPLNPASLIVGQTVGIVSRTGSAETTTQTGTAHVVKLGETLTTVAARYNQPPLDVANANGLSYPDHLFVGQRLRIPSDKAYRHLDSALQTLDLGETAFVQGNTATIYLETNQPLTNLSGTIQQMSVVTPTQPFYYQNYIQTFPFAPFEDGYIAIVGFDSFVEPGLYQLELTADDAVAHRQRINIQAGLYATRQITISDNLAFLLRPEVRSSEDEMLAPSFNQFTPVPTWDTSQPFRSPLDQSYTTELYGDARSYNNGPYQIYHTGIDYGAPVNTPILAVANGTVVFSGETGIRGNFVIIDHGLGVMTAYAHLQQRLVVEGDVVTVGQAVGSLGNTGLSTGAHLHWEVRIRGVAVNGLQWLSDSLP